MKPTVSTRHEVSPSTRVLLLATTNPGKAAEMAALLAGLPVRLQTLADFPTAAAPVEKGESYLDNARTKAHVYAAATGLAVVAEDSGLEIDALGGAPGLHSARFAGPRDEDRCRLVLDRLRGVPPRQRSARYRCAAVWADPEGAAEEAEASCEGIIADASRGTGGFGYDPIFFFPRYGRTFGELTPEEKAAVSHRGKALWLLRARLALRYAAR